MASRDDEMLHVDTTGTFAYPDDPEQPWPMPRDETQATLVEAMRRMPHRLSDYGYQVNTGPLVWNRHKPQLRSENGPGRYPLIWAEAVTRDGDFVFRARKRNHEPYFEPEPGEDWFITREPCVILQRTTSKEQQRRLIATALPADFLERHGAVVIENHLNIIRPDGSTPVVPVPVLSALLASTVVDHAFRCISGSVAVSAYELNALPLPAPEVVALIEHALNQDTPRDELDRLIHDIYLPAA